jgi:hypothetical protein
VIVSEEMVNQVAEIIYNEARDGSPVRLRNLLMHFLKRIELGRKEGNKISWERAVRVTANLERLSYGENIGMITSPRGLEPLLPA